MLLNNSTIQGNYFKENLYIEVHNLNGTSDNEPPKSFALWKDWWEEKKGEQFDQCSNRDCKNDAEVGAHVQKVRGDRSGIQFRFANSAMEKAQRNHSV